MSSGEGDGFEGRPRGWSTERVIYEVGFRAALLFVLAILSCGMFLVAGAFGGPAATSIAHLP